MNINLLKKLSIASTIGLLLAGCGGTDEGESTGLSGTQPVQYEGPVIVSVEEESGELIEDLLVGTDVGQDETVILRNINLKTDSLVPPKNAILFKEAALIIDTDMFSSEIAFGEEFTYEYSYIIENGGGALLDENGDEISRDVSVTIVGVKDPVESISLSHSEVRVPPNFPLPITANIAPVHATFQSVIWEIADTSYATVDENGVVTGLMVGSTSLTVTSVDNPDAFLTVPVEVTFDIPNPIGMMIVDVDGEDVGSAMTMPECVSYPLTANQLPVESGFTNPITWTSSDETKITVDENGLITAAVDSASSGLVVITATNDEGLSDQVAVTVVNNIACNQFANNNFDFASVGVWPWDAGWQITKSDSAEGIANSNALSMQSPDGNEGTTKAVDWGGAAPMIAEIGTDINKYYKVSYWVKNLGTDVTNVYLYARAWVGSDWGADTLYVLGDIMVSDEWQYIEETVQGKPWDNSQVIWLEWGFPSVGTPSDVLIDDLAIYEVPKPE